MTLIGFYVELDIYSGSIPPRPEALQSLVNDLKILCLACDHVIVSPGSYIEHPLCLPAFECLDALVREGVLGTSADVSAPSPLESMKHRIDESTHGRSPLMHERYTRRDQVELQDRWLSLTPSTWTVRRSLEAQTFKYSQGIHAWLREQIPRNPKSAGKLLDFVERRLGRDSSTLSRHALLAQLAEHRGWMSPRELSYYAEIIQAGFFRFGALGHNITGDVRCVLVPGPFIERLRHRWNESPDFALPPILPDLAPAKLSERLRTLGVEPRFLLSLSATDLLELIRSPEWQATRQHLLGPPVAVSGIVLPGILRKTGSATHVPSLPPAPVRTADDWQLSVYATISTFALSSPSASVGFVLDWPSRRLLGPDGGACSLTPLYNDLLVLMATAGDAGVDLGAIARVLRVRDVQDWGTSSTTSTLAKKSASSSSLRNRIDVHRATLATTLQPIGLGVLVADGRWRLTEPVMVRGSPWDPEVSTAPTIPPEGLSLQARILWTTLAEHHPYFVALGRLLEIVGKDDDRKGRVAVAVAMTRLIRRLRDLRVPWSIERDHVGGYRLARDPGCKQA